MTTKPFALSLVACLCAALLAYAQFLSNGNFQAGILSRWLVVHTSNGLGGPGTISSFNIDGPGPPALSLAARFWVGVFVCQPDVQQGIDLSQPLADTCTPLTSTGPWTSLSAASRAHSTVRFVTRSAPSV